MNISENSFYGRAQAQYTVNDCQYQVSSKKPQAKHYRNLEADVYEITSKPIKKVNTHKKTKTVDAEKYHNLVRENSIFRALVGGIGAIGCVFCLSSKPAETLDVATIHVDYGTSINQVADIYGSDADVIMEANDLDSEKITKGRRIVIPSAYNPVNDEIMSLQEQLFSSDLKADKREEIEDKILELQNTIYLQEQIASTYSDGEFIYFKITLPTDETASNTQKSYNGKINVEEFKHIFNIQDGAIKDNNSIGFDWTECGTVMEYSNQDLLDGDVIKVPVGAIL